MTFTKRAALAVMLGALTLPMSAMAAETHVVTIKGFAFEPAALTIAAGDTVEFVNEDGAPHTATADGGAFDTGRLSKGGSASVTLDSAGTFDYFCAIHRSMTASITVN